MGNCSSAPERDPPCHPRTGHRLIQVKISIKGTDHRKTVNITASPHSYKTIPVKKICITLHQTVRIFFKLLCYIRKMPIPIPPIPQRRIKVKRPAGIILKTLSVTIPSVPRIIFQHCLGMVQHDLFIDLISLIRHKRHIPSFPAVPHRYRHSIRHQVYKSTAPVTFCKGLFNHIHKKFTFQGKK